MTDDLDPDLFIMMLGTRLVTTQQQFTAAGVDVTASVDDVQIAQLKPTLANLAIVPHHREKLGNILNIEERAALFPPGHACT